MTTTKCNVGRSCSMWFATCDEQMKAITDDTPTETKLQWRACYTEAATALEEHKSRCEICRPTK